MPNNPLSSICTFSGPQIYTRLPYTLERREGGREEGHVQILHIHTRGEGGQGAVHKSQMSVFGV